jgi:hypothetical protein
MNTTELSNKTSATNIVVMLDLKGG